MLRVGSNEPLDVWPNGSSESEQHGWNRSWTDELKSQPNRADSQIQALSFEPRSNGNSPDAKGLFAFVDSRVKTLLRCLAEPPADAYEQAVEGKAALRRILKSVGASMVGDSHAAMAELLKRGEENRRRQLTSSTAPLALAAEKRCGLRRDCKGSKSDWARYAGSLSPLL
jgi:hypothetical protein